MDVGEPEPLLVLAVALVVFGPAQLPKLAQSSWQAAREFRQRSVAGSRKSETRWQRWRNG